MVEFRVVLPISNDPIKKNPHSCIQLWGVICLGTKGLGNKRPLLALTRLNWPSESAVCSFPRLSQPKSAKRPSNSCCDMRHDNLNQSPATWKDPDARAAASPPLGRVEGV